MEFAWDTRDGQSRTLTSTDNTIVSNGGWRHLACVYDAEAMQMRIYVDGQLRASRAASGEPAFNAAALYLGVRMNSGSVKDPFAGALDGVRLRQGAAYAADFTPLANPMAPDAEAARSVLLQWQPPATGGAVGSYTVARSTNNGAATAIHVTPILRGVFTDEGAPASQLCYHIAAVNTHGDAGVAAGGACLDLRTTPALQPPHALAVTLLESSTAARLVWQAPAADPAITGYAVYRRAAAAAFAPFAVTTASDTAVVDSTLGPGTWCYIVRSLDSQGATSAASDTACVDIVAPPSTDAPLGLTAAAVDSIVPGNASGALVLGFDAGAGQVAADISGNGNDAILGASTALETSDPTWIAGLAGSAVRFDGSNDRLRIADSPSLRLSGSFTIEAWVRRASTGTEDCIVSKGDTSKRNFMVMLTADGRIDFTWETTSGSKRGLVSAAAINDDSWHHVACVYDQGNGQSRIFLDGILVQWVANSGTPAGSADPVHIGARTTAGSLKSFFHGTIDLLRAVPSAMYADNFTPPTLFFATTTQSVVHLQWQAPAQGTAAGYRIYRQSGDAAFTAIGPALVTATHFIDMAPVQAAACYRVTAVDGAGIEGPASEPACTGAVKPVAIAASPLPEAPQALALSATPNPFNPATTLHFELPQAALVTLVVYDVRGARVATLVRGALPAGAHSVRWLGRADSGGTAASGVYFARVQAGNAVRNAKLLLLK